MEKASFGVLAETKRPPFEFLSLETDTLNSTPRGSLLAVMNADHEQFNQRL
jgi:hypothetical protein